MTPVADVSREVEAMGGNGRETARIRASQIMRLVDLTREGKAADEPARAEAPEPAPPAPPEAATEETPVPVPPPRHRGFELPLALGVLLVTGVIVLGYPSCNGSS